MIKIICREIFILRRDILLIPVLEFRIVDTCSKFYVLPGHLVAARRTIEPLPNSILSLIESLGS